MPAPDPLRLLRHANDLIAQTAPQQTDLRKAISSAYYAVFHFIATKASDLVVGTDNRSETVYRVVYRNVDHQRLKTLGNELRGSTPGKMLGPYTPIGGFGSVANFARLTSELQELRHTADYDPIQSFTIDDAKDAIAKSRRSDETFRCIE